MSQSDYIKYKRVAVELKAQTKLSPVIEAGQYTRFKDFALENTILSNKLRYDKLQQSNTITVFGITQLNAANCASFLLCSDTNKRVNRMPLLGVYSNATPLPFPKKEKTIRDSKLCSECGL
jgi:hypothetical protein